MVQRFYENKVQSFGAPNAPVAVAQKLASATWRILTHNEPLKDEDEALTTQKEHRTAARAREAREDTSVETLTEVGKRLAAQTRRQEH